METLTQIKDRVAQKHGYANWNDIITDIDSHFVDVSVIEELVDEATQEYANTRCIRQKSEMIKLVEDITTPAVLERLKNAPLETEE